MDMGGGVDMGGVGSDSPRHLKGCYVTIEDFLNRYRVMALDHHPDKDPNMDPDSPSPFGTGRRVPALEKLRAGTLCYTG